MNQLPQHKKVQIINLLVEGMSLRAISRLTGCSINTVTKILVHAGKACEEFHNKTIIKIKAKRVECDEIWSFVYCKKKNVRHGMDEIVGDVWTWIAIDADTRLVISYIAGRRDNVTAIKFMHDLYDRLNNRIQLTTDGFKAYRELVEQCFGFAIDFAQLEKIYDSREHYLGANKIIRAGAPDMSKVSTSYVERQNLTMRMHMRRFTRFTNAFSKKIQNHLYAIALHFVYYNFCKIHQTLRVTPAMEAGLTKDIMEISDIVALMENDISKKP
ncbi:MAG TPA: IS1 family transposase [Bacteroidia bacterium]|nr:IS1 family transposase [Bacteroidia bacterium]